MGKASWGAIWQHMETTEKALRRHTGNTQEPPRGSQETPRGNQRHPGDTQETLSRHSGATQETPGSTQEAPRRNPGGTQRHPELIQEASRRQPEPPRRHAEGTHSTQEAARGPEEHLRQNVPRPLYLTISMNAIPCLD